MRPEDILVPTPSGVCCKLGSFHIDPTRAVERALITHAHSDHARAGHGAVLATRETLDLMRLRYGENFAGATQAIGYGESISLGGVKVTFHPAGHVLGSAQIAVEANGLRIVASGDYKDVADPTCAPFELIPCDVFITEATFALPVFRHGDPDAEIAKLLDDLLIILDAFFINFLNGVGQAFEVLGGGEIAGRFGDLGTQFGDLLFEGLNAVLEDGAGLGKVVHFRLHHLVILISFLAGSDGGGILSAHRQRGAEE